MALNFEIPETDRENLNNGEYLAVLKEIVEEMDKWGSYVKITEQLNGGYLRYERFYTGYFDEAKKLRAIKSFGKFCKQLSGFKTGQIITDDDLLGKKYILTINNAEYNGKMYENVVKRALVEAPSMNEDFKTSLIDRVVTGDVATTQYGVISIPQTPAPSNQPLNDEVPF